MNLMCFNPLLLFLLMHKFPHLRPVQILSCWFLNPLDTILIVFDSYLVIWHDDIFQVYLLYFLLIYQNLRGEYKHFLTIFLTQNGKVEIQCFFMILTFAAQTIRVTRSEFESALHRSIATSDHSCLHWHGARILSKSLLPALGHIISTMNNYFFAMDFPAKKSFKRKWSIIHIPSCKWPKLQMALLLF